MRPTLPRVSVAAAAGLALGAGLVAATSQAVSFEDVAERAGLQWVNVHGDATKDYIVDTNGNGAAWLDYDGDRDLDLLLVSGSTRERLEDGGSRLAVLYRNEGARFEDVTPASGLDTRGWGMGACVADYDNDGDRDVYVTALGANHLFANDGDGTFTDVTTAAGVGDARWGMNCAFGDYDLDGDVDLYVANHVVFDESAIPSRTESVCSHEGLDVYCGPRGLSGQADVLYRNDGDGSFTDVTEAAGIDDRDYYGFGVLFSDLDADGWPDIFVANDSVPNLWFHNDGDGTFSEEGLGRGIALSNEGREQAAMGAAVGDYDGDGDLDLFVTNFAEDYNTLYDNGGAGLFADVSHRTGLGTASWWQLGWGTGFFDADNDARLDLFVANGHVYPDVRDLNRGGTYGQRNQIFRNVGDGRFVDVSDDAGPGLAAARTSRGAAFGDNDNDGGVDELVVNLNDRPALLENVAPPGHHWLTLRLRGVASNRDGIGARVWVTAGGRTQIREVRSGGSYLSHNDLRVHVGLGTAEGADGIRVQWPAGTVDRIGPLAADAFYDVEEGSGRAVPWPVAGGHP
jgi:hypothetical protein